MAPGAEPVRLAFTEFYPITHTEEGHPAGAGVGVAERLTAGLPIRLNPEAFPLRRLLLLTEARPIVIAALRRRFGSSARDGTLDTMLASLR